MAAAILALLLFTQSCAEAPFQESTGWIMGTLVSIRCSDADAAHAALRAMRAMESEVNAFESGVNAAGFFPAGEYIEPSMNAAQRVRELSGGAFNISVYDAMQAWGLVENEWQQTVDQKPDEKLLGQIAEATARFAFTLEDGIYTFSPEAKITLGGVAKGAAGDVATGVLKSLGVESAIISLGGNVVLVGKNAGRPWSVGIIDPVTREPALKILAEDTTVTTAGAYERYVIIDGIQYGHIIDPATAAPARNEILSATVICSDGAFADALATAVFVMGEKDGLALIEGLPEAEAILMLSDHTVASSSGAPDIEVLSGDWRVIE